MIDRQLLAAHISRAFIERKTEITTGTGWRPMAAAQIAADVALDALRAQPTIEEIAAEHALFPARLFFTPNELAPVTMPASSTAPTPTPTTPLGPISTAHIDPGEHARYEHRQALLTEIRDWYDLVVPDNERESGQWLDETLRTVNQARQLAAGDLAPFQTARTLSDLTLPELERLHQLLLTLAEGVTS